MTFEKKQWKISGFVAAIILAGSAASTVQQWWPYAGWKTPKGHERGVDEFNQKLAQMQSKHDKDIVNLQTANGVLSDQIRCRQWKTELDELYGMVTRGDNSRRLSDRILRHRDIMDDRSCDRFGSY